MKVGVHPNWYQAKVLCACGNSFVTGSTLSEIRVEICSKCHPLFTGQQKFVDTLGQVERYQKKNEAAKIKSAERQRIQQVRTEKKTEAKSDKPSLKDLLMQARKDLRS